MVRPIKDIKAVGLNIRTRNLSTKAAHHRRRFTLTNECRNNSAGNPSSSASIMWAPNTHSEAATRM